MLTLSDEARAELDAYFAEQAHSPIRVYLAPGGCSGPRLALALDTPGDEDSVLESNGYTFCINKELLSSAQAIDIAFSDMGFMVRSEAPLGGGGCSPSCCSSCGGGCSS
ncbi:IscA/HesB family protein [Desulfovibrio sp. OttesenSCG-928-G15]|nr:IscA/HesB family protein [Desulfovibrio sp. OttesenSCG-928-G15]